MALRRCRHWKYCLRGLAGGIGVVSQLNELQDNSTAQSHRVSKIAREVVEMSLQLQQNEALTDQQVQAAARLSELSARLTQRAQQFRVS